MARCSVVVSRSRFSARACFPTSLSRSRLAVQRIARPGNVFEHEVERRPADDFEGRHVVAGRVAQAAEQAHCGGRIGHGGPGGGTDVRAREQLQRRRRDEAQAAFGADEEMLEVVAGIVLAQGAQAVPDATVGEDHFEAEGEFAGIAVAQDLHAAGVGGSGSR